MGKQTKPRVYYFVTSDALNTIPIVAGNWIALTDASGFYYDAEDENGVTIRRNVSGNYEFIYARPTEDVPGEINTLYICKPGDEMLVGTNIPLYELYVWDEHWKLVANNTNDTNVTSLVDNTATYYLTGSSSSTGTTGNLIKRSDVYVDSDGQLHAPSYAGSIENATYATTAGSATNDSKGNPITGYVKSIVPGTANDLNVIDGNDNSITVNTYIPPELSTSTRSTVPPVPTNSAKEDYGLTGKEWKLWSAITVGSATSATKDNANQTIKSTYIKSASYDSVNNKLILTKGDDTTIEVPIPIGTYDDYSGGVHGLVPPIGSGTKTAYFLNMAGNWVLLPTMQGATSQSAGTSGMVPAPAQGNEGSFLKGDGTWGTVTVPMYGTSTNGIVPSTGGDDDYKFLNTQGWRTIPVYVGATSSDRGVSGLVPIAQISEKDKYLKGDGTWEAIPVFTSQYDGLVPTPGASDTSDYLSAGGTWEPSIRNTTGTSDINSQLVDWADTFTGDGTTVEYTLQYAPYNNAVTVTVEDVEVPSTDYTVTTAQGVTKVTFNTAPAASEAIVISYETALSGVKLYIVGSAEQTNYNQTYTKSTAYSINGKLYSEDKAVATTDQLIVIDDSTTSATSVWSSSKVNNEITNLPNPMIFKGTLGTGGTIQTLPTASSSNEGYTYKVITAGTYASQSAKVGDVFVSNATEWVLIPAGDTDSDTWRNIKVNGTEILGSAISTGALDLVAGNGINLTNNAGAVTIDSTEKKLPAQTLSAGSTQVVFTDSSIVSGSWIDVATSDGTWYSNAVIDGTNHTCTLTFPVQTSDISISIRVS